MFGWWNGSRPKVRTFRVPMFVIAAALIGLMAVLATLQYRWLGRISDAERERMTANLGADSSGVAQDFDQELTRAYVTFQLELSRAEDNLAAKLSPRYDRWMATARYPRMVRDVYVVRQDEGAETLQRYIAGARFVEPAEWSEPLRPIREAMAKTVMRRTEGARGLPNTFVFTAVTPQAFEQVPALVIPMPMMFINTLETTPRAGTSHRLSFDGLSAFVILHLDRD